MGLDRLDLIIIAVYLAGITAFGVRFRKRQHTLRDYFLADRNVPWWAISLSIVAAETSTLTIISIPGLAYRSNMTFLQLVLGYVVGRFIISFLLIPHYFRGELYTAYQLMERRFGGKLRSLTASLFLITRSAAEGVRVFAVAIVVRITLGAVLRGFSDLQRDAIAIGIVTALTLIYTFEGGMTAVIWTDVVQMFIYVGGTLAGFVTLLHLVPGGWPGVQSLAGAAGKFQVFDFSPEFFKVYTFWAGLIGGAFLTTASHGTDQLIVQRLLAARSEGQSKLALIASGFAVFFQFGSVPAGRRAAVRAVSHRRPAARVGFLRRDFSHVYRDPHAARNFRPADCRDSGGGNEQPERRAEFPLFQLDRGFLFAAAPPDQRPRALAPVASFHPAVGAGAVCAGDAFAQHQGGGRGRTGDCLGGLRGAAGRVWAGRPHQARQ